MSRAAAEENQNEDEEFNLALAISLSEAEAREAELALSPWLGMSQSGTEATEAQLGLQWLQDTEGDQSTDQVNCLSEYFFLIFRSVVDNVNVIYPKNDSELVCSCSIKRQRESMAINLLRRAAAKRRLTRLLIVPFTGWITGWISGEHRGRTCWRGPQNGVGSTLHSRFADSGVGRHRGGTEDPSGGQHRGGGTDRGFSAGPGAHLLSHGRGCHKGEFTWTWMS